MLKKQKSKILLLLIIILAVSLRLWRLAQIPEGFHADEAAFGYNAYSLLLTGKDEYGEFLPLVLRSFDDYKGAIYAYLAIPFVVVFGLNELAVRLPTLVFGVGLTYLSFLIAVKLTGEKRLGLLTSFATAVSPWSILLSRVQSDPLVTVFFIVLGFYFFLIWLERNKRIYFFLQCICFMVSFFTYVSARVFFPIFVVLVIGFYFKQLTQGSRKLLIAGYFFIFVLDIFLTFGASGTRFGQIGIFRSPRVIMPMEEEMREDGQLETAKFFHNKLVAYGKYFAENYLQYLSYDFLFLKGGQPAREAVPNSGLLYPIELLFLSAGLYFVFRKRMKWGYFMAGWLLLTPLVLSLAIDETPNVHRFFLVFLPVELLITLGIIELMRCVTRKKILLPVVAIGVVTVYLASLASYLHQLFIHQPKYRPWNRGFAYKELSRQIQEYSSKYQKIVVTKANAAPYIYLLFYQKYDPQKYQAFGGPRDFDEIGFDKFYFTAENCPFYDGKSILNRIYDKGQILYVAKGDCPAPENTQILNLVKWGDDSPAFILHE